MVDEISIYVSDRPGELAQVLKVLESVNVNILGLTIDEVQSVSIARFIFDYPDVARQALEDARFTASVSRVFTIQTPNAIGSLNQVVSLLAKAKINIRYVYLVHLRHSPDPVIIVRTFPRQEKETKELFAKHKIRHVRLQDLIAS
jgi:hypothetical protein